MADTIQIKANTEEEKVALRTILARGAGWTGKPQEKFNECPCGWFFSGARCPDKACVQWKKANGIQRIKLYAHVDKESNHDTGKRIGLEGDAMRRFAYWGS